ncbi:hypothetical protein B0H17DRAFT_633954 [Mycena rosella]|uniref:Uncharacterized protein n=1 Tax=Mycena rosella TaxID=1033263 RepID=A0AAD7DE57_MYCRO|nr:hypothetical protein B0H17DRAFT_633954 [Mycena rosella]
MKEQHVQVSYSLRQRSRMENDIGDDLHRNFPHIEYGVCGEPTNMDYGSHISRMRSTNRRTNLTMRKGNEYSPSSPPRPAGALYLSAEGISGPFVVRWFYGSTCFCHHLRPPHPANFRRAAIIVVELASGRKWCDRRALLLFFFFFLFFMMPASAFVLRGLSSTCSVCRVMPQTRKNGTPHSSPHLPLRPRRIARCLSPPLRTAGRAVA